MNAGEFLAKLAQQRSVLEALTPKTAEYLSQLDLDELLEVVRVIREARGEVDFGEPPEMRPNTDDVRRRLAVQEWRVKHRGDVWSVLELFNRRLSSIEEKLDLLVEAMSCEEE